MALALAEAAKLICVVILPVPVLIQLIALANEIFMAKDPAIVDITEALADICIAVVKFALDETMLESGLTNVIWVLKPTVTVLILLTLLCKAVTSVLLKCTPRKATLPPLISVTKSTLNKRV